MTAVCLCVCVLFFQRCTSEFWSWCQHVWLWSNWEASAVLHRKKHNDCMMDPLLTIWCWNNRNIRHFLSTSWSTAIMLIIAGRAACWIIQSPVPVNPAPHANCTIVQAECKQSRFHQGLAVAGIAFLLFFSGESFRFPLWRVSRVTTRLCGHPFTALHILGLTSWWSWCLGSPLLIINHDYYLYQPWFGMATIPLLSTLSLLPMVDHRSQV